MSIGHIDGECPNLFKLDGRYVLVRSTYPISYIVGKFRADDLAFRVGENRVRTLDCGYGPRRPSGLHRGLYGTRTFHDARGRIVLMGWVSGFKEGRGWNGCASLPRVLSLTDDELDVAGTRLPAAISADGTLNLHQFFDRSVLEVFIDGGRRSVTKVVYPPEGEDLVVEAFAEGGAAEILSLAAWTMKSIWDGPRE